MEVNYELPPSPYIVRCLLRTRDGYARMRADCGNVWPWWEIKFGWQRKICSPNFDSSSTKEKEHMIIRQWTFCPFHSHTHTRLIRYMLWKTAGPGGENVTYSRKSRQALGRQGGQNAPGRPRKSETGPNGEGSPTFLLASCRGEKAVPAHEVCVF